MQEWVETRGLQTSAQDHMGPPVFIPLGHCGDVA